MVDLPIIGRRGTLALSTGFAFPLFCQTQPNLIPKTALTGILILISTTARSSNSLLGWNCAYSFTSNIMYGVLYAITPELFPTKDRGTGSALTATGNRICGVMVCEKNFYSINSLVIEGQIYRPRLLHCMQI